MRLRPDDEFVVMGCDGLWDHVAYDTAIEIVAALKKAGKSASPNHLNRNDHHLKQPTQSVDVTRHLNHFDDLAGAEVAADALVREALDQHSTDNITCVVVYLDWQRTTRASSSDFSAHTRTNATRHDTHTTRRNGETAFAHLHAVEFDQLPQAPIHHRRTWQRFARLPRRAHLSRFPPNPTPRPPSPAVTASSSHQSSL